MWLIHKREQCPCVELFKGNKLLWKSINKDRY